MLTLTQVKTQEQIAQVARLAAEIWHEHYDGMIGYDQVEYMLRSFQSGNAIAEQIAAGTVYKLAAENGVPIGYYAAESQREKNFLSKIYLKRSCRGKGYARRMVEDAHLLLPSDKPMYLHVNKNNTGSIACYKALGFAVTDSVKSDIGNGYYMDDYIMEAPPRKM